MKLPQYLSDLLHLRYVAGVRAKEGLSRGMFRFDTLGEPECGTPGCLLGWLWATPEGAEIAERRQAHGPYWGNISSGYDESIGPFILNDGWRYSLFSCNPKDSGRTDAEELDYRLNWVDEEITRECIKQGLCPEETPKAYEHALEREKEYA